MFITTTSFEMDPKRQGQNQPDLSDLARKVEEGLAPHAQEPTRVRMDYTSQKEGFAGGAQPHLMVSDSEGFGGQDEDLPHVVSSGRAPMPHPDEDADEAFARRNPAQGEVPLDLYGVPIADQPVAVELTDDQVFPSEAQQPVARRGFGARRRTSDDEPGYSHLGSAGDPVLHAADDGHGEAEDFGFETGSSLLDDDLTGLDMRSPDGDAEEAEPVAEVASSRWRSSGGSKMRSKLLSGGIAVVALGLGVAVIYFAFGSAISGLIHPHPAVAYNPLDNRPVHTMPAPHPMVAASHAPIMPAPADMKEAVNKPASVEPPAALKPVITAPTAAPAAATSQPSVAAPPPAQPPAVASASVAAASTAAAMAANNAQLSAKVSELEADVKALQNNLASSIGEDRTATTLIESNLATLQGKVSMLQSNPSSSAAVAPQEPMALPLPDSSEGLPVLQSFDLRGVSKDAAVVKTPTGIMTIPIGQDVPGAGTAEDFKPWDGTWELITSGGIIRPGRT